MPPCIVISQCSCITLVQIDVVADKQGLCEAHVSSSTSASDASGSWEGRKMWAGS